ncbi:MAG TPA: DUF1579 family protein [Polyangiales bacterium]|jgi:hypothetical protein|nr:DUF1579 family protein [Polyangiales bacterium]
MRPSHFLVALCLFLPAAVSGQPAPGASAVQRMLTPGPEDKQLAARAGVWDVTFTMWPAPGAKPTVVKGLIAEREMIGKLLLQENMHPAPDSSTPEFRRIDYLSYDRVEGRWKYVSMDTRFPVNIMPAWSFGGEKNGVLSLLFEPLGFVGFGPEVEGRMMRSDMIITHKDADHELKQQHFALANGTGAEWLAVQYQYTRRKN